MSKMNFPQKLPVKQLFLLAIVLCYNSIAFSQETTTITGVVIDSANNTPLIAASVLVKGTTKGATTDAKGRYSITASPGSVLTFQSIGYAEKQITIGDQNVIDVRLSTFSRSLDQVVVVGYGTQKKSSLTSAISTLDGRTIADLPTVNLSQNLTGRLSGVITKQSSGQPGSDAANIFIRGISTTGNTQPLIIVDGIPRDFQNLDPNVIESFTVLKDAAAVAPYGVAGANGVILVTTKTGKIEKPNINYSGYIGIQNPTIIPEMVNGYEYALLRNLAAENEKLPPVYTDVEVQKFKDNSDPDAYPRDNILYNGLVRKNYLLQSHSINVSGGTEKVRYFANFGFQGQEGMWNSAKSTRYNLNMNLSASITKTTEITFLLNGNVKQFQNPPSDIPGPTSGEGRIFEVIKFAHPGFSGPNFFSNGDFGSVAASEIYGGGYDKTNTTQIFSQMSLKQKIPFVPGLSFKGTFAYDPTFMVHRIWSPPVRQSVLDRSQNPPKIVPGIFGQTRASLDQNDTRMERYTFQTGVDFERSFGFNNIKFTGVFEAIQDHTSSLGAFRRNFNLLIDEISLGSSSNADMRTSGISSNARQVGLVYRVNYDYNNKYMFEASGRYDGSYYFSKDKRFGFFPAFSLGWNIANENFIKDNLPWVNVLKIRSSYGEVGALAGAPFQYLSTFSIVGPGYKIGGEGVQIANENSEPNPGITWERSKKTDVGFDGSFFNYQFDFGFDYFFEKRSNMLVQPLVTVPREYGIGLGQENAGIMQNQGIEVTAAFHHQFNKEFSIHLNGNLTYAHNKVLQIFETSATYNNLNRRLTGRPLGEQFGYKFIGYFLPEDFDPDGNLKSGIATQPWGKVFPGDMRYQDTNSDGKIDINDNVPIGEPINPQIVYGFSPSINYKGFDVNLLFQGAAKVSYYIRSEAIWPFWNSMAAFKDNFDYWRPDNLNAAFPRITLAPTANNTQTSSHWMQNVSYLRLKNIMVSYDFMRLMKGNMADKLKSLKLFVSGQNMVTWAKIKNLDPEMINARGNSYPQQKVLSVGLNVGF